jgi:dephospho-CoA kinase
MNVVGLTGGIASGKSTVASYFRALGAKVIDADKIYHRLLTPQQNKPSPLALHLEAQFGPILTKQGELKRSLLGKKVFGNANQLQKLAAITHPAVAKQVEKEIILGQEKHVPGIFYDVPLLYENNLSDKMLGVIVVWMPPHLQKIRLAKRDGLDDQQIEARLKSQLPLEQKKARADWVIDNSHNLEHTHNQVQHLWQHLVKNIFANQKPK